MLAQELVLYPPAKLNLGLSIQGRRADGYHLLQTVLYPYPALTDVLRLRPAEELTLRLAGAALPGDPADNLCLRAWHALRAHWPALPPVQILLEKRIPAGAGLGGGSADAAYVLRGLSALFGLPLSAEALAEVARPLGADVPFFLQDQPMLATGIGQTLEALTLPSLAKYRIELLLTPLHSDTAQAYRDLQPADYSRREDLAQVLQRPPSAWREALVNDLERPVFTRYPALAQAKAALYARGAHYAAMSGSGSALFGIFPR